MSKQYTEIDDRIQRWMAKQHMFFVSTAPSQDDGRVNCSPKGLNSLRAIKPKQLAYADTGGSGIETVAHLKQNGRITLMMCAFEGPPKIYRFYGRGRVVEPHDDDFDALAKNFANMPSIRNVILIEIDRIIDSCGYGVPMYQFQADRDSLPNYFANKSEQEILDYRRENNATSLDGLPGLDVARIVGGEDA